MGHQFEWDRLTGFVKWVEIKIRHILRINISKVINNITKKEQEKNFFQQINKCFKNMLTGLESNFQYFV